MLEENNIYTEETIANPLIPIEGVLIENEERETIVFRDVEAQNEESQQQRKRYFGPISAFAFICLFFTFPFAAFFVVCFPCDVLPPQ